MRVKYITEKISKADRKRIEEFADARCGEDQSLYKKRGGFKRSDIVIGAIAEVAVYNFLKRKKFKINKPDFTIHETKQKSFDADLQDERRKFHVKGQSMISAIKYGNSWLMQKSDKLVKAPLKGHYLVPTMVNDENNEVDIFGFISMTAMHEHFCFGECKIPYFRYNKVAIYLEKLKDLSYGARWGLLKRNRFGQRKY